MNQELIFLCQLLQEIYQPPCFKKQVKIKDMNLGKLVNLALNNNCLYFLSLKLQSNFPKLKPVAKKGGKCFKKISKTLKLTNHLFDDYLLIKTVRGYPRLSSDLDILVKDFKTCFKKIKKQGFQSLDQKNYSGNLQVKLVKKGFWPIHLHHQLSWADSFFMDPVFIWRQPKNVNFASGLKVNTPRPEANFLIHLAHLNFETLHLTLPELLYLYSLKSKLKSNKSLKKQAKKYHWQKTLTNSLNLLNQLHKQLYSPPENNLSFPFTLPRSHLVKSCWEKGLLLYSLKKLRKSLKVILKKDAFTNYYIPSVEQSLLEESQLCCL